MMRNADLNSVYIDAHGQISVGGQDVYRVIANSIFGDFVCENEILNEGNNGPEAVVPSEWITNGTLVEYEVLGDCPKHNSTAACHDATTSNTTCIWCEKANACITSNDKDVHVFEVNGCQIKNMTTDTTTLATTETDLINELKTNPSTESHLVNI
ncbi:unnamed protein product [Schistosoma margrebowiei]|uniref:Uncharacterized protein n=1 Tax=Schistosoma margrebowiei TaxID=48269 RepID=A0A183N189_9TREM|nr:unnamed protein product [Schistosoma margrebowiei]